MSKLIQVFANAQTTIICFLIEVIIYERSITYEVVMH